MSFRLFAFSGALALMLTAPLSGQTPSAAPSAKARKWTMPFGAGNVLQAIFDHTHHDPFALVPAVRSGRINTAETGCTLERCGRRRCIP